MKRSVISIIAGMILALITLSSCDKEENFYTTIEGDTLIVNVNISDTTIINNHLYGGDTEVKGGDVHVNGGNTTNVNGNGENGSNSSGSDEDLDGFELLVIPTSEFIQSIHYKVERYETDESPAEFIYQEPALDSYALAYYDGTRANVTTSAFPLSIPRHKDPIAKKTYVAVWTEGVFGAKDDKDKPLYALNIYNGGSVASVDSIGTWNDGLLERRLSGDCYLVGFHASDGNNTGDHTGRIVIGTDGRDIYILRGFNKTTEETYKIFKRLDLPFEGVTISGGSTAASAKHNIISYKARSQDRKDLKDFVQ